MTEFLLVNYPESRQLLINEIPQTWRTNMVVRLEPGTYEISLLGRRDFAPDFQTVTLRFTASTNPAEITFHPLPPSAIQPASADSAA